MIVSVTYGMLWDVWRDDGGTWSGSAVTFGGEVVCRVSRRQSRQAAERAIAEGLTRWAELEEAA